MRRTIIRKWFAAHPAVKNESALFVALSNRARGKRLGTRGARMVVDNYLRRAGLKTAGRSCHALRRSFATWLLEASVPIENISDLLGHSSVVVTSVYAKVVDRRKYVPAAVFMRPHR